jgi:hypothetical protein
MDSISTLIYSQLINSQVCTSSPPSTTDLIIFAGIALVITFLIGFINYGTTLIFSTQQLFGKQGLIASLEIDEIIFTLFIYIVVITLYTALTDPATNRYIYMEPASNYSSFMVIKSIKILTVLAVITEGFNIISYIQYPIKLKARETQSPFEIEIAIGQIAKPLIDTIQVLIPFINTSSFLWISIFYLLCLTERYALTYLFLIGVALRAFPYTRSFGSSLMALSISLFFFLPFVLHINGVVYKVITGSFTGFSLPEEKVIALLGVLASSALAGGAATILVKIITANSSALSFLSYAYIFTQSYAVLALGSLFGVILITYVETIVNHVLVFTILANVLNVLIVFGIMQNLAKILNAPIDIGSLLRLI